MLSASSAAMLALALSGLPTPPNEVVFPAERFGKVVFDHKEHLELRITCRTCHGAGQVGKIGFTTQAAHGTCRACHQELSRGPIGCGECHERQPGTAEIPELQAPGAKREARKPATERGVEPLPKDERDRSRLDVVPGPSRPVATAPDATAQSSPAAVGSMEGAAGAPTAAPGAATDKAPGSAATTVALATTPPRGADGSSPASPRLPIRPPRPTPGGDAAARFTTSVAVGLSSVADFGGNSGMGPSLHVRFDRERISLLHTQQWTGGQGHGHVLALVGAGEARAFAPRWTGLLAAVVGMDTDFEGIRSFPAVGLTSVADWALRGTVVQALSCSVSAVLDPLHAVDAVTSGDRFLVTFSIAAVINGSSSPSW